VIKAMIEIVALAFDKANQVIVNPLIHMWQVIHASQLLSHAFLEYLKVVEIVMVHALGSIENKQCLNFVAFLKKKVHNCLNNHLHQVVSLNAQKFFSLGTFHTRLHMRCGQMFN
jgi:hypothetical protein